MYLPSTLPNSRCAESRLLRVDQSSHVAVGVLVVPHQLVRINISSGGGMIISYFTLPDQPLYVDYYWNLFNLALELNFNRFLLYIRSEAKYTLGLGPKNLLGREWVSLFSEGGPTIFTLGIARKW